MTVGEAQQLPVNCGEPTLSAFYRESWFTCEGARLKARRLRARGIPDLKNWRFITLTVDDRSASPLTVYLRGKEKLRRFTASWRECLGRKVEWLWKLELHEDGYPHWHMLIDYLEKIPRDFFEEVQSWWGLGRINVRRVRRDSLHYIFKYICKGGQSIPDWVLDYKGVIRCVQGSSGFFTAEDNRTYFSSEPTKCRVPVTLRRNLEWDTRRAILIEHSMTGQKLVSVIKLQTTFAALLQERVNFAIRCKTALPAAATLTLGQYTLARLKYEHKRSNGLAVNHPSTDPDHCELACRGRPHFERYGHLEARQSEDVGGQDHDVDGVWRN